MLTELVEVKGYDLGRGSEERQVNAKGNSQRASGTEARL